jgi:hypothetical protein
MLRRLSFWSAYPELRAFAASAADHTHPVDVLQGRKEPKWKLDLKVRVRKSFQTEEEPTDQRIFAGVILERYPICLPTLPDWRADFIAWQHEWNKWKYKIAKPGLLDVGKDVDPDSPEVRFAPSWATCGGSLSLLMLTQIGDHERARLSRSR